MQHTKSFKTVNGSNLNEWYKTTLIHVRRNLDANSYRKGRRSKIYPSPEMKVISKDETVPGRKFIPEQDRSPKNAIIGAYETMHKNAAAPEWCSNALRRTSSMAVDKELPDLADQSSKVTV